MSYACAKSPPLFHSRRVQFLFRTYFPRHGLPLLSPLIVLLALGAAAAEKGPPEPPSLIQRLQELVDSDKNRQALALGEAQLAGLPPSAALYYLLTQASYGDDDYVRTQRYALKTLELDPAHELAARFYVTASRSLEHYEEGLEFGRHWTEKNPNGSDIYKDMAMVAHDAGRIDEAKALAAEAFKRKPESPRIAGVYFYFLCVHGDAGSAAQAAQEWAVQHKADTFFWAQLGKGLSDAERWKDALPILLRAIDQGSDDLGVPNEIMDSYRGLSDRAAAAKFIETYGAGHEVHAYLWRAMGAMHFDAEAYGEAFTALQKAKKLDPENVSTSANLIFTLIELKRASEGIVEGQRWLNLELSTATPAFHRAMGNAYFARDRWLEAEPHYRAALALDSTRIQDARELLVTLVKLKRAEEAVQLGRAWREKHPDIKDEGFEKALAEARKTVDEPKSPGKTDDSR